MNTVQDEIEEREDSQIASPGQPLPTQAIDFGQDSSSSQDAVTATANCEAWNTQEYFQIATVEDVTACLATGADLEMDDNNGRTPLHLAAAFNFHPGVIEALLAAGANLEMEDVGGYRPLHLAAAFNENPAVIEALLNTGAELEARDRLDSTPLYYATEYNDNPAVREVLMAAGAGEFERQRAAVICEDAWNTREYFQIATVEDVTACLAAGADLEAKADDDYTPLHMAARYNGNPAVIEALLIAGADLEAETNLGFWSSSGFEKITLENRTPLNLAASNNSNPAVIEALVAAGANVNARDRMDYTPLHRAARYNSNPAVIEALVAAGADLEAELDPGIGAGSLAVFARSTPLHEAASFGSPAVIEALLAAGADPTKRDDDRATPLHRAARYNNDPAALEIVLATGTDLEARDDEERTPLNLAARYNDNPSVIEVLINAGAAVEAQDEDGRTPLYRATDENDNPAVREVLLAAGAGQTERQRAAARARREDNSGPGFFDFAVAAIGGTAIAAAGGGTDEAVAAGGVFAEGVLSGNPPARSSGGGLDPGVSAPAGNTGITAGEGSCQVPGYPSPPGGVANLGFSWCPASVDIQRRSFALQAAGAQCAIATGSSSTPEQITARRQEINASCNRLDVMQSSDIPTCQCPAGLRP